MFRKGIRRRGRWTFAACAALVVLSATAPVTLDPHPAGWRPLGLRRVQGADLVPEVVWRHGQLGPCGHQGGARSAVYGQRPHLRLVFDTFDYVEHAPCAERVPRQDVGALRVLRGRDAAEEPQDAKGGHVRADEHGRGEKSREGKRDGERVGGVSADEDLSVREPAEHLASGPQYQRVFPAPGGRTTADLPEPGSGRVETDRQAGGWRTSPDESPAGRGRRLRRGGQIRGSRRGPDVGQPRWPPGLTGRRPERPGEESRRRFAESAGAAGLQGADGPGVQSRPLAQLPLGGAAPGVGPGHGHGDVHGDGVERTGRTPLNRPKAAGHTAPDRPGAERRGTATHIDPTD